MPAVQRLIIDTDGGIDDAVALALAVRSPELSVCAVTTTYGNNTLQAATRNVRAVLGRAGGRPVPVIPGAATPLDGHATAPRTAHGLTGMGGAQVDPLPAHIVPDQTALGRVILSSPAPITLITIGPSTNLAHALRMNRRAIRERVRAHIALGDCGNGTHPDDFNVQVDAEAADQVRRSELRSTCIPLEIARGILLSEDDVRATCRSPIPFVAWLSAALRHYADYQRVHRNTAGCCLPDITAVAMAIAPGVFSARAKPDNLDLDAGNGDNHRNRQLTGRHHRIAFAFERERIRSLLIRVFGSAWCGRQKGAL